MKRLLNITEVAEELGKGHDWVVAQLNNGVIPYVTLPRMDGHQGKRREVLREDLEVFLKAYRSNGLAINRSAIESRSNHGRTNGR